MKGGEQVDDTEKIAAEGVTPGKHAFGYVLGGDALQSEGLIEAENIKEALERMLVLLDFFGVIDVEVTSKPEER